MFPLRSTALALCLGAFLSAAPSSAAVLRLGVVTTTEPGFAATTVTPVVSEMEKLRPDDVVHVVQIAEHDLLNDIERERPDLLICSAWCFLNVLNDIGAHPVATRKTDRAASAVASIGAALVVRSDRTDLRTLEDLRGKKAAATLPHSVDGYPAVRLMLREKGFSDEKFFSGVNFLTFTVPDVLSAVLSGDADVSILPACALERAQEEGLVEPGLLRVIGLPPDGALACSRSTALYPDITAGILPWTPNELTRDFLTALLESGHADGYEWVATSDLRSVSNLYQELHLGRWAILDDTSLSGLWKRYGRYAVFALLLVLLLIANEYRLKRLVEHRTAALTKTLREKELLARKEEAARERLASLERMGAISQLCAMIAHELKQPMGAVLNFLAVLRMRSGESIKDDPVAERAMEGAQNEARRMAEIVDRVRGYAKRQRRTPEPVDLGRTIDEALSHLKPGPQTTVRPRQKRRAGARRGRGRHRDGEARAHRRIRRGLERNRRRPDPFRRNLCQTSQGERKRQGGRPRTRPCNRAQHRRRTRRDAYDRTSSRTGPCRHRALRYAQPERPRRQNRLKTDHDPTSHPHC